MKSQISSIQYLRALGALGVVASHADHSALIGQSGVDLFFVISGFIIWSVADRRPSSPIAFLWHRAARVVPLYWVATLAMAAHQRAAPEAVIKSLLFIPYFGAGGQIWPVLVQGWTLNYEMFFYILMAVVLPLPRKLALTLLASSIGVLGLAHILAPADNPILLTYTNPLALEFLAGVGLAEIWRRQRLPTAGAATALVLAAVLMLWLPGWDYTPQTWRFVAWGLPMAMIVAAALSLEKAGRIPNLPPLVTLGDASFSIYLCHPFLISSATASVAAYGMSARVVAAVVVSSLVGVLSSRLFERPATAFLRRFGRRAVNLVRRRFGSAVA
jgi:exopolysaccharide production protein ExoZ